MNIRSSVMDKQEALKLLSKLDVFADEIVEEGGVEYMRTWYTDHRGLYQYIQYKLK